LLGDGIGSHTNNGNPFTGTLTCIDREVDNTQTGFDPGGWDHVVFIRPITSARNPEIDVLGNLSTSIMDGNIFALNGRGINDAGSFNSTLVNQVRPSRALVAVRSLFTPLLLPLLIQRSALTMGVTDLFT
jgi:hypothetical protein